MANRPVTIAANIFFMLMVPFMDSVKKLHGMLRRQWCQAASFLSHPFSRLRSIASSLLTWFEPAEMYYSATTLFHIYFSSVQHNSFIFQKHA
jgi:hypothetical protein